MMMMMMSVDHIVFADPSALATGGFYAAYPAHPLIARVLLLAYHNIYHQRYGCTNLDVAGPKLVGRCVYVYVCYVYICTRYTYIFAYVSLCLCVCVFVSVCLCLVFAAISVHVTK